MKNRLLLALTLSVALFGARAYAQSSTWTIDPAHSSVNFEIIHMGVSHVHGAFGNVKGTITLNEKDIARSSVAATIDTTTVSTGVAQRDTHLKSADFLDVEKFPTLTFKSTSIESTGGGNYDVIGDLTIHGVTKSVTLAIEDVSEPSKDPWGNHRLGLSGSTRINRKDFGIAWNSPLETGGLLVGEEVAISLDVEFIKA